MLYKRIREKFLAEFVYGAIDGTITTFAIISGSLGASLSPVVVLILGCANVLADGFSMAVSNYLSERSEAALGGTGRNKKPLHTALVTFVSFVGVGAIPILPFIAGLFIPAVQANVFVWSAICTLGAFAGIGYARGRVTHESTMRSVLETLVIGGVAAVIAFSVGYGLEALITS